jgi:hypothetical protein
MSYEQHCNDYALHGDPERDHYDHEFNAQYDRFDGWGDPDFDIDPSCPECGDRGDCLACKVAKADLAKFEAEYAERNNWSDDVPF